MNTNNVVQLPAIRSQLEQDLLAASMEVVTAYEHGLGWEKIRVAIVTLAKALRAAGYEEERKP